MIDIGDWPDVHPIVRHQAAKKCLQSHEWTRGHAPFSPLKVQEQDAAGHEPRAQTCAECLVQMPLRLQRFCARLPDGDLFLGAFAVDHDVDEASQRLPPPRDLDGRLQQMNLASC